MQHKPRPLPLFLELLRSETAQSPDRMAAALQGLRAYQSAKRGVAAPEKPVVAQVGRAKLLDYGGEGPAVIFVPSLINPPTVLDLAEGNSFLRWLAAQDLHPLLVDWGTPAPDEAGLSVTGHIEQLLLPLLDTMDAPYHLAGYCLGGTMAAGAAAVRAPRSLTMIAAPWRFDGFPTEAHDALAALWDNAFPTAQMIGALPMEVLQTGFWQLDTARTIGKFEKFGRLDPDSDGASAFVALEDWSNDGPPLTFAAARELIEEFFARNVTGKGQWRVDGKTVDPAALTCPVLDIISATDRIVPEASAARAGEVWTLAQGHVGMIVGGRGRKTLWQPLAAWLSQVQQG